jgi:hypothetical protein
MPALAMGQLDRTYGPSSNSSYTGTPVGKIRDSGLRHAIHDPTRFGYRYQIDLR